MSVVIASSLGLPIREHETLIVSISIKGKTAILFLRISSSALAASNTREDWGQPEMLSLLHSLGHKIAINKYGCGSWANRCLYLNFPGTGPGMQFSHSIASKKRLRAKKKREVLTEHLPECAT